MRTQYKLICQQCQQSYLTIEKRQKFCSRSCSASFNNALQHYNPGRPRRAKFKLCQGCSLEIPDRDRRCYCSIKCKQSHELNRWLNGELFGSDWPHVPDFVRRYMFSVKGRLCWECGWQRVHSITKVVPVEIDHINGDTTDHRRENLRVLCPNCHSLTSTFRHLNPNGRKRKKSTAEGT